MVSTLLFPGSGNDNCDDNENENENDDVSTLLPPSYQLPPPAVPSSSDNGDQAQVGRDRPPLLQKKQQGRQRPRTTHICNTRMKSNPEVSCHTNNNSSKYNPLKLTINDIQIQNSERFDPFQSISTGHQRGVNLFGRNTAWRKVRQKKLGKQFHYKSHGNDKCLLRPPPPPPSLPASPSSPPSPAPLNTTDTVADATTTITLTTASASASASSGTSDNRHSGNIININDRHRPNLNSGFFVGLKDEVDEKEEGSFRHNHREKREMKEMHQRYCNHNHLEISHDDNPVRNHDNNTICLSGGKKRREEAEKRGKKMRIWLSPEEAQRRERGFQDIREFMKQSKYHSHSSDFARRCRKPDSDNDKDKEAIAMSLAKKHSVFWDPAIKANLAIDFMSGWRDGNSSSEHGEVWNQEPGAYDPMALFPVRLPFMETQSPVYPHRLDKQSNCNHSKKKDGVENEKENETTAINRPSGIAQWKPTLLFHGLNFYINGSTFPHISDHKLKQLLVTNGGSLSLGLLRRTVTHVILGEKNGLSGSKLQKEATTMRRGSKIKYVNVEWVLESVKAGKRLPEARFANTYVASKTQPSVYNMFSKR